MNGNRSVPSNFMSDIEYSVVTNDVIKSFGCSISFCFIRYEVGLCNPFNIFLLLFYMLRCGYAQPFIYFLVFGFICYQVVM